MALRDRVKHYFERNETTENDNTKVQEFDGNWEEPRANEVGVGITGQQIDLEQTRDYSGDMVFRRIKNSGELMSIMQAVIDDIIGSGVRMQYIGRTDNAENPGKRSVKDARRFWKRNKEIIADSIMDAMAMGDGYLYKKSVDDDAAQKAIKSFVSENYSFKHEKYEDAAVKSLKASVADNMNETKDLEIVPASTVEHDIDEFGNIERFIQSIGTKDYDLDPEKVVHHSYMNLDGETYGFSPVAALFAELDMLANAKDYNGVKFNNAAVPNKVFKLPNDGPNGQNFEMVKQTVKKYRQLKNKHRDLVLTGDIEIEDLNDTSDMEFRELAQYVTRVVALSWGVPPSRIGGGIGSDSATESAMASEGYNKRIQRMQDKYETILNRELFEPMFSIRIEFKNPDIKSEIRKAERDLRKTEVVKQQASMGMMNRDAAMDYLGKRNDEIMSDLSDEDFQEAAKEIGSSQEDMASDSSINQENAEETVNEQIREGVQENMSESVMPEIENIKEGVKSLKQEDDDERDSEDLLDDVLKIQNVKNQKDVRQQKIDLINDLKDGEV